MSIIDQDSLSVTLDAINDALFFGRAFPKAERKEVAGWIASRHGQPGSYAGMFAPTPDDFANGIKLFTGETIGTRAGVSHILGQEACRVLHLLGDSRKFTRDALSNAMKGMADVCFQPYHSQAPGMFCCGKCSVALWRTLNVSDRPNAQKYMADGMKSLQAHRDGKGRWRVFPFYYTLLALSEIDLPGAAKEIRYTATTCERLLKRSPRNDKYDLRRRSILEKTLAKA